MALAISASNRNLSICKDSQWLLMVMMRFRLQIGVHSPIRCFNKSQLGADYLTRGLQTDWKREISNFINFDLRVEIRYPLNDRLKFFGLI